MSTKILLSSFMFCFFAFALVGQNSIPNGGFENWTSTNFEYPTNYVYTTIYEFALIGNTDFGVEKTTDAYQGNYALKLMTNMYYGDQPFQGFALNFYPDSDDIMDWSGGIEISETPSGISGYYKYNYLEEDAGTIIISFLKEGVNIGLYIYNVGGVQTEYTQFDFDFDPPLADTPDEVLVGFASSNMNESEMGVFGSELIIDAFEFKGVSQQPADLNGDFENWEDFTIESLDMWNTLGGEFGFLEKTEDAYAGNYAVKVVTPTEYNEQGDYIAKSSGISTGYWNNEIWDIDGGYPYSNDQTLDTLEFWYKYEPMADDQAAVNIHFRKEGVDFWGHTELLDAADEYQHVVVPINFGVETPDNVIIQIISTNWGNEDPIYEGSTLYIDNIGLKSEDPNTGIFNAKRINNISLYPNPTTDYIMVSGLTPEDNTIEIYNVLGEIVYSKKVDKNIENINVSNFAKGMYVIKTQANKIKNFMVE